MTISSTDREAGPFTGNGVTTAFPFDFKIFATTDLVVKLLVVATGVESTLVLDSDYTASMNADQNANPGGVVTYNPLGVPMASTHKLSVTSNVAQLQSLNLTNGGGFFPAAIMTALDRAVVLIQQLTSTGGRGLYVSIFDTVPAALPSAVARANKLLGFDGNGDPTVDTGVADVPVSAAMTPVVTAASLAAGRTALDVPSNAQLTAVATASVAHALADAKGDTIFASAADTFVKVAAGANGQMRVFDSAQTAGVKNVSFPRLFYSGFQATNNASNTKIDLGAGMCIDPTGVLPMELAAGTIDCGTVGANGLDAGALANNTWYHTYIIGKTDGTIARIASTNATTPSFPSGYTLKRRVKAGQFRTNGSAQFIGQVPRGQNGQRWLVGVNDVVASGAGTNPGTAAVSRTLTVPTGIQVTAHFSNSEFNGSNNRFILWTSLDQTDTTPSVSAFNTELGPTSTHICAQMAVKTNTSAAIRYRTNASGAADTSNVDTHGWTDDVEVD